MNAEQETFFYWVKSDDGESLGRSNAKGYACHMAKRYSYDTARFPACNMRVVTDPEDISNTVVADYPAHTGVLYPPDAA